MAAAELLNQKINDTNRLTALAEEAIGEIAVPAHTVGYSVLDVNPAGFDTDFTRAEKDATPMPVYHPPTVPTPAAPTLVGLHGIAPPEIPAAPSVETADLFRHQKPSGNLPEFQQVAPGLHGDDIFNEIKAVARPVLEEVALPSITPLTIRPTPQAALPGYAASPPPGELQSPADYAAYYQRQYDNALPAVKGFMTDLTDTFMAKYAPDYDALRGQVGTALAKLLAGKSLPDGFEDALFSRHEARIRREQARAVRAAIEDPKYAGWVVMPGEQRGALEALRTESVLALAGASTDVAIDAMRQAVQSYQFALSMADGQLANLRNLVLSFADKAFQVMDVADRRALNLANLLATQFEHERSKAEFSLALMRALDDRFKVQLEAALADLTVYSEELKALELKSNVEFKQVDAAKVKLDAQELKVRLYTAIVDAIAKQAVGDELKVKQFGLYVGLFDTQVKAKLAEFDVFKAENEGDKAVLEGRLSALTAYQERIKGISLQLDAQKSVQQGDIQANAAKLDIYKAQNDALATASKVALERFTAEASLKELGLDIYKAETDVNRTVYEASLTKAKYLQELIVEAFRGNVLSKNEYYRLQHAYAQLGLGAQEFIAQAYASVASAAQSSASALASVAE